MAPCAVCGELMHRSRGSRPVGEAAHRWCRFPADPDHGTYARYKRGCRCDACRAANVAKARAWQKKHDYGSRPEVLARRKSQRSTDEARQKERARWSRYYSENRAALIAKSKEKEVRRKGAPMIPFTVDQLESRLSMWPGCWMCGAEIGDDFHVDHVKPLARGGWHCLSNLRPACAPCNLSKGAKWPLDRLMLTA